MKREFTIELNILILIFQVIRSGQKLRKKSTDTGEKRGGWFSGFWGKKECKKKDEECLIPESKFQVIIYCTMIRKNFVNYILAS